ncbi:hypothetical protein [Carboxylicivirga sp. RSCT41]|uniref:hypothetical protein n=1 Tax=Carboxylicivirga agarovorans TaxID=3417570 RepID=UPI003D33D8D6
MWIKKTKRELEDDSQNKNSERFSKTIKLGIWSFIIIFLGRILFSITIGIKPYSHYVGPRELVKIDEIPEYFADYLMTALFWALALMAYQYFKPVFFNTTEESIMCDKCFLSKNDDNNLACKCGGNYYRISNYKWVEPQDELIYPDMTWIDKFKVEKNEG